MQQLLGSDNLCDDRDPNNRYNSNFNLNQQSPITNSGLKIPIHNYEEEVLSSSTESDYVYYKDRKSVANTSKRSSTLKKQKIQQRYNDSSKDSDLNKRPTKERQSNRSQRHDKNSVEKVSTTRIVNELLSRDENNNIQSDTLNVNEAPVALDVVFITNRLDRFLRNTYIPFNTRKLFAEIVLRRGITNSGPYLKVLGEMHDKVNNFATQLSLLNVVVETGCTFLSEICSNRKTLQKIIQFFRVHFKKILQNYLENPDSFANLVIYHIESIRYGAKRKIRGIHPFLHLLTNSSDLWKIAFLLFSNKTSNIVCTDTKEQLNTIDLTLDRCTEQMIADDESTDSENIASYFQKNIEDQKLNDAKQLARDSAASDRVPEFSIPKYATRNDYYADTFSDHNSYIDKPFGFTSAADKSFGDVDENDDDDDDDNATVVSDNEDIQTVIECYPETKDVGYYEPPADLNICKEINVEFENEEHDCNDNAHISEFGQSNNINSNGNGVNNNNNSSSSSVGSTSSVISVISANIGSDSGGITKRNGYTCALDLDDSKGIINKFLMDIAAAKKCDDVDHHHPSGNDLPKEIILPTESVMYNLSPNEFTSDENLYNTSNSVLPIPLPRTTNKLNECAFELFQMQRNTDYNNISESSDYMK